MKKSLALAFAAALLFVNNASAATYSFGDSALYWPGWANGTNDDTREFIGQPQFTGGEFDIDNGYLKSVKIFYTGVVPADSWFQLKPGDLFLDLGSDADWDYVVKLGDNGNVSATVNSPKLLDLIHFAPGIALGDASAYELSNDANRRDGTPWGANPGIREDHPWAINANTAAAGQKTAGAVQFSGWQDPASFTNGVGTIVFDFLSPQALGAGLFLGQDWALTLGFTINCANDVIYESPIPEPTSMVLLGCGLLGLVGRRKMKAASKA